MSNTVEQVTDTLKNYILANPSVQSCSTEKLAEICNLQVPKDERHTILDGAFKRLFDMSVTKGDGKIFSSHHFLSKVLYHENGCFYWHLTNHHQ